MWRRYLWAGSIIKPLPQSSAHSPSLSQIFLEIRFPLMSLVCNRQCASYPQHALKGCVNGHFTTSIIYWGLEYGRIVSLEHMVFWRALLYSRYQAFNAKDSSDIDSNRYSYKIIIVAKVCRTKKWDWKQNMNTDRNWSS